MRSVSKLSKVSKGLSKMSKVSDVILATVVKSEYIM